MNLRFTAHNNNTTVIAVAVAVLLYGTLFRVDKNVFVSILFFDGKLFMRNARCNCDTFFDLPTCGALSAIILLCSIHQRNYTKSFTNTTMSVQNTFYLPPSFQYGVAAGFVGVYASYYLSKDVLIPKLGSPSFNEKVKALKPGKEATFFYATFASMVHAIAQSFFHPAYIALGLSGAHNANRVTYFDDGWPAGFSGIFVGYLVADFLVCGPANLGPMYCVHHVSAALIWTWSTGLGAMQWYASMLQFCELSTIFMNLRQWVLTAGYDSGSSTVLGVSLAFFATFFGVRVLPLPGLVYKWLTNDFAQLSAEKGTAVALASSSTLLIHVGLQSFWFMLMVKKIIKLVTGGSKKTKKDE